MIERIFSMPCSLYFFKRHEHEIHDFFAVNINVELLSLSPTISLYPVKQIRVSLNFSAAFIQSSE
jgi:hypothetical protein